MKSPSVQDDESVPEDDRNPYLETIRRARHNQMKIIDIEEKPTPKQSRCKSLSVYDEVQAHRTEILVPD